VRGYIHAEGSSIQEKNPGTHWVGLRTLLGCFEGKKILSHLSENDVLWPNATWPCPTPNSVAINLYFNPNSYKVEQPAQICMCDLHCRRHRTVAHRMSQAGLLHCTRPRCNPPLFPTTIIGEPKPRTLVTTTIGYYSFVTSCLIFTSHAFKFSVLTSFPLTTLPPPPATSPISR